MNSFIRTVLSVNKYTIISDMWHNHHENSTGGFVDYPSGFNRDGTIFLYDGDRTSYENLKSQFGNRIATEGNIYLPTSHLKIQYNEESFIRIPWYFGC